MTRHTSKLTTVFKISVVFCLLFTIWGILPDSALGSASLLNVTSKAQAFLTARFGWLYLLSMSAFLLIALFLIFSRFGSIRLGKDTDRPDFGLISWFAMLFSAGMGIGLVFWGVSEPLTHFHTPPVPTADEANAARLAMRYSFFHWGLHPWALYAMVGLAIAYSTFRKGRPATIGDTVASLMHSRYEVFGKNTVEILAIVATTFGVATSLGLGAQQISGGFHFLIPGIPNSFLTQLVIILIISVLYMYSAASGLDKGIRILSNANIIAALLLMVGVLLVGPGSFIMDLFVQTSGAYLQNLPVMSFRAAAFEPGEREWINSWTIFYWAWWISWSPFVGTFIARVSRGRTIREFVIGITLVPTVFGLLWFTVFGGTAIWSEMFDNANLIGVVNDNGIETGLFALLETFGGFGTVLSILAVLLITTFFITSADSATYVLGMLSSGGSLTPSLRIKLTWGVIQSSIAAVLLSTGGLGTLQAAAILAAFPFVFVVILMIVSLFKDLSDEPDQSATVERKASNE
ncbi:BCCT family transporter [Exiguobacterium flavidum]|uniref:BCCT family transporter n=1 Tax=Exiguobacterium flavidum TaxID=2184695 RepID=UPI000DF748DC|nr:BCCT family transporter [Exiguobacterium flavidum]